MDNIVDNLMNYETVKLFAREDHEYRHLKNIFQSWLVKFWGYSNSFRLIDIIVGLLGNSGLFAILFVGLYQLDRGMLTIGQYIMILGFISSFYPKFFQLIFELRNIAKHIANSQANFRRIVRRIDFQSFI